MPYDSRVRSLSGPLSSELQYPVQWSLADDSLILVVVGWFAFKGPSETRGEVVLGRFGKNTLSSFPVQVFAYT